MHTLRPLVFACAVVAISAMDAFGGDDTKEPELVHQRAPLTDDVRAVARGNNQFAVDIYRQLASGNQPSENVLVSPLSISTALAMTYAGGARNQTAQQMAAALHFTLPDERLHAAFGDLLADLTVPREGYELNVANRLFGQNGMAFKQPFLQTVASAYRAPLEAMDFVNNADASRLSINDWVAGQTRQRIKDLLPPGSVDGLTRLVLTNAVYFNGAWKFKFDADDTADAPFYLADGRHTTAELMYQKSALRYGDFNGFKALELPYAGNDLAMLLLLPDAADGLANLETSLSEQSLQTTVDAMSERSVEVYLPKFSFQDSFALQGPLQILGISNAFSPGAADLSGIADADLYITGVLHKTFVEVNEEGTEAAAATGVVVGTTCACPPPPPPVFRADHPFLFALRDTHTGSLMFLGRVVETDSIAYQASIPEPTTIVLVAVAFATLLSGHKRRQFRT